MEPILVRDSDPTIGDAAMLRSWIARSPAPFHLEIDTGMARGGIRWGRRRRASPGRRRCSPPRRGWEGVFTHFHSADTDAGSVATQWQPVPDRYSPRFPGGRPWCTPPTAPRRSADARTPPISPGRASSSTAARPEPSARAPDRSRHCARGSMAVRTVAPGESVSYGATWRAARATTVATLGIGYADGLPRAADRGARGRRDGWSSAAGRSRWSAASPWTCAWRRWTTGRWPWVTSPRSSGA